MSSYRRSGYDYAYDDYPRGERWDRDRFERMGGRSRAPRSGGGESYRYEEDDRYYDRRGSGQPNSRVEVYEESRNRDYDDRYYYDDERYSTPRRSRPAYLDEDRYQVQNREIAPYRPKYERGYDDYYPPPRRQYSPESSYDRRPPPPRNEERDVNVNLNVRGPQPPPAPPPPQVYEYKSSPRREYYEEDDYEDVRIRRERERSTYRRYDDHDDRNESYESYESSPHSSYKRGRTRMPKRLVHRSSLIQKGYPFEEETDFYIVQIALRKDQIDEVIKISETYFHEEKLSVTISETKALPAPEPAQESSPEPQPEETEVVETVTTKVIENPTEEDLEKYGKQTSDNKDNSSGSGHGDNHHEHQSSHHHHSKERSRSTNVSRQTSKTQRTNLEVTSSHHTARSRSTNRGRSQSRAKEIAVHRESSSSSSDDNNNTTTLPDRSRNDTEIVKVEKDSGGRGQFVAQKSPNAERSRSRRRPSQKMVNAALYSLT